MAANIPLAVRDLVTEYGRFLRTSYRFLDERLRTQFEEHLARTDLIVKGPYVTLAREFERGRTLAEIAADGGIDPDLVRANWPFDMGRLYRHQEQALEAGRAGRSFVVTTGTGSGKTEAFLLPVPDAVLRRKAEGVRGVQAILLYPMNALANDQLERMRRLLRGTGLSASFGLYTGDSDATAKNLREAPAETERTNRMAIRANPPDLLLTNYKQLEFLLIRRDDRGLFTKALRFLVLDEVHSYRGALATEIACLIRRLKAHAGLGPGEMVGVGTSATVAAGAGGAAALAGFATSLFGETIEAGDIVGERYAARTDTAPGWMPPAPRLADSDLVAVDTENDESVVALAERLTGRRCPADGFVSERVGALMDGNRVVRELGEIFSTPAALDDAAAQLRQRFPGREAVPVEQVRREIEAYLIVGSVGDDDHPPRLRPKLHTFFHGIYDVSLCLNAECRTLVREGGTECPACGSVARPAALCRTCGQDFVKVRFEKEGDDRPVATGDFFSDEHTAFLTHKILDLPESETDEEDGSGEGGEKRPERKSRASKDLEPVSVCPRCGCVGEPGKECPKCHAGTVAMWIHKGKLNTCPACGDVYTRGDIVTPLRTGTASTVSVLTAHHLDHLKDADRKLLVFADNRQDVAHQAGYTADKHRTFAMRHLVAHALRDDPGRGVYLVELPERLFDHYRAIGVIPSRLTRPERERWLEALTYEAANEFTRHSRQRQSLENLGLAAVDYEFLDDVAGDARFVAAASAAGLQADQAILLVRALLDVMRKNRAVTFDFFQEYIDPNRKRRFRELEVEPYCVRFPETDRSPKAYALDRPDHVRKAGWLSGFTQENPKAGQLTAPHKLAVKLIRDRAAADLFLHAIVPALVDKEVLEPVPDFPIPKAERVHNLKALQIAKRVIRLYAPSEGFRCNACKTWRPYTLPVCPTPRCGSGRLVASAIEQENYYVRRYLDHEPRRLAIVEHSAQISGEERAKRETGFKEGRLDALVCTPTLELGVDIGPLLTVVLRNAPPTPANYTQRVGRAGRRLRIGFVSTFCAGGAHDRHAFDKPEWLVAGTFEPPRLRLDNVKVVTRHLRSYLLECVTAQLPALLGDLLDDMRVPTRWKCEEIEGLLAEVRGGRIGLVQQVAHVLAEDRRLGRVSGYGPEETGRIVDGFERDLGQVLDGWWERVRQLDREFREYSTVGSPRQDDRKASARKRAYFEITQDRERAYTLNYLSTKGLLPAYQFPLETFSLDPGVQDTPTLYRPSPIAIEEFAPGNFVYANGRKLRSIRVLFPGGPGTAEGRVGRSDAETSGRLQAFHFCEECGEAVESGRNRCPRCHGALPHATDLVFVDAFEAEENLRISSDEESRQKQSHERRENLLSGSGTNWRTYPYPLLPLDIVSRGEVLVTNWGRLDGKTARGSRFWLCPDCGRHLPHNPNDHDKLRQVQEWKTQHAKFCKGEPASLVLGYRFETDCLVLTFPSREDEKAIGRSKFSPTAVTLAEALLVGAGALLELETGEIAAFPRRMPRGAAGDQIVFYETVPGGAGYLEEMAARLPEVAGAAMERLYGHPCLKACYQCLKHYRNQTWHPFFDKDRIRDLLVILSEQVTVEPQAVEPETTGLPALARMLGEQRPGASDGAPKYRRGAIEEPLAAALAAFPDLPPGRRDFEVFDKGGRVVTVPDFAWPDVKLAVYCDGFAFHGNIDVAELDAGKRNRLESEGWSVLAYWGRTILRNPAACARQVADVYRQRQGIGRAARAT
ncbi:MAG: DEAD/DEAH box helicase [Deltaproteobacteria bacterium]|nr:DEAD/DEAH box helicase [Deltaproteobacteria bacterium]